MDAMTAAVDLLREADVEWLIHCGDVGGRQVLEAMTAVESAFIWGDRDRDRMGLLRVAQRLNVVCYGVMADFEADGKRIVAVHGDDKKVLKRLLDEQQHDFLFCGHGPEPEDRQVGKTRVIHPGSLYGGAKRTAAVVNTDTGEVRVFTV
jgi:putative phosphoesterase